MQSKIGGQSSEDGDRSMLVGHQVAWLDGAHGQGGQGCGQLETDTAADASLGQGLTASEG